MLCLDESTPIIMALSLVGAVLLIVGGSLWGSGDAGSKREQTVVGIALFASSIVLLGLAGVGCWCNQCFCTPDRKSRIAERFYGSKRRWQQEQQQKQPGAAGGEDDLDEEAADCGSLGSSFRSFRSSRRSVRRGASARRDRVLPANGTAAQPQSGDISVTVITEQPETIQNSKLELDAAAAAAAAAVAATTASHEKEAPIIQQTSIDDVPDVAPSLATSAAADLPATEEAHSGTIFVSC